MNQIPYIISKDGNQESMTLFLSGVPRTVDQSHQSYAAIKEGIDTLSVREIRELLDVKKAVAKQLKRFGNITVGEDGVTYKGEKVHSLLADRMMQMLEEGYNIAPWALFMENLMQNPAKHAVDELYLWLERSNMPITERGNFLAYKKVQDDYTSYHRNADGSSFHNDIGTLCQMPRNKVDDNRNRTCSSGLHFCSWDYLPSYMGNRGKVVLLEVNPAHVVSIPSDYNNAKGRAEAYLVVGEIPEEECKHAFNTTPLVSFFDSDFITHYQGDDIDYSSIEDNWYDDYGDEDEEDEKTREEDYDTGFVLGRNDYYLRRDQDPDSASIQANYHPVYLDEFSDGYYDGWYDAEINDDSHEYVEDDGIDEEEVVESEVESYEYRSARLGRVDGSRNPTADADDLYEAAVDMGDDISYSIYINNVIDAQRDAIPEGVAAEVSRVAALSGADDASFGHGFRPYAHDYESQALAEIYEEVYEETFNEFSPVSAGADILRNLFRNRS